MATKIQARRDTAANWTSTNPTLAAGEPGFETDTGKLKIGDGASAWTALSYISGSSGPRIVALGNMGASPTLALASTDKDVLVTGTLTANATLTVTGLTAGVSITLVLTQDATGSRTFVFSPTAKKVGGQPLPFSTTPGAVDVVAAFSPDGTNLYAFLSGRGMA